MTINAKNNSLTIEEKLQPWFDQAEYLIFFILGVMVWSAILVNLIGFLIAQLSEGAPTPERAVAGLLLIIPTFIFWLYPIFSLKGLERARRLLGFAQRNPLIVLLIYATFAFVMASTTNRGVWAPYALIQICILILLLMFTVVVLFLQPFKDAPFQTWRKVVIGAIGIYFVIEAILYGLVFAGILSIDGDAGLGIAYGRVVTQDETINISNNNNYGWHYADFRLEDDSHHILLHGDTFIEALQVPTENHLGQQLEQLIKTDENDQSVEVLAQGFPGYGPSMYLNNNLSKYIWQDMSPDEVIVFFHLVNDFQIQDALDEYVIFTDLEDTPTNRAVINDNIWDTYHNTAHQVISGHNPPYPYQTILTYSMLWNLWESQNGGHLIEQPLVMSRTSAEQPFGVATILYDLDMQDDDMVSMAYNIIEAQLEDYKIAMEALGTSVRLVTIPYFPEQFYATASETAWDTAFDTYDLSLTEQNLRQITDELDIDFLGMLNYLGDTDLTSIKSFYFNNGTDHLTVEGHRAFAEAIYECFYSEPISDQCGIEE